MTDTTAFRRRERRRKLTEAYQKGEIPLKQENASRPSMTMADGSKVFVDLQDDDQPWKANTYRYTSYDDEYL